MNIRGLVTLVLVLLSTLLSAQSVKMKGENAYIDGRLIGYYEEVGRDGLRFISSDGTELFTVALVSENMLEGYYLITFMGVAQQAEVEDEMQFRKKLMEEMLRQGTVTDKNELSISGVKKFIDAHPSRHGLTRVNTEGAFIGNDVAGKTFAGGMALDSLGLLVRNKSVPPKVVTDYLEQDGKKVGTYKRGREGSGYNVTELLDIYLLTGATAANIRIEPNDPTMAIITTTRDKKTHQFKLAQPLRKIELIAEFLSKNNYL